MKKIAAHLFVLSFFFLAAGAQEIAPLVAPLRFSMSGEALLRTQV
jgi:hypothetical protein